MRYLENAGWYMDEVQPWAFFFVIPGMTALFGSYLSVREQEEDTMKSLRLIPLQEIDLMRVKMILTLLFSIGLSMLCFGITFLTEAVLHIEDLSASFVFMLWKEYVIGGIGIFFAVFPIIAFAAGRQKNCWSVFLFTEIYSVFGSFVVFQASHLQLLPAAFYKAAYDKWSLPPLKLCPVSLQVVLLLSVPLYSM